MGGFKQDKYYNILLDFLQKPLSRKAFDRFFTFCFSLVKASIRNLHKYIYLDILDYQLGRDPLDALTNDILGELLASKVDRPFYQVFDYYQRHGLDIQDNYDVEKLYDHFKILVFGFTRKHLGHLKKEFDPQLDHLKRRFKDVLKGGEYQRINSDGNQELIGSSDQEFDNLNKSPASYQDILEICNNTYVMEFSRSEWCRQIFKSLNGRSDIGHFVILSDLLRAVISVNLSHIQSQNHFGPSSSSIKNAVIRDAALMCKKRALSHVKCDVLERFLKKQKLTQDTADKFFKAADIFLSDLIYNGSADKYPEYFRTVMPDDMHSDYLDKYKYEFETILNTVKEYFEECVKKNLYI